jgi:hypothetical protein
MATSNCCLARARRRMEIPSREYTMIKKQIVTVIKKVAGDYTPLYYSLKAGE